MRIRIERPDGTLLVELDEEETRRVRVMAVKARSTVEATVRKLIGLAHEKILKIN